MSALATCFPKANPNPLAPPWFFPSAWLSEAPAGYRDEFQFYTITQALTANQVLTVDLITDTAGQCNFYWRHFGVFLYGGTGVPALRLRDSDGFIMMNTRVVLSNGAPYGNQDVLTPILPPHRMAPAAKMSLDLIEESGNAITVVFMFSGVKRWALNPNVDGRGGSISNPLGGSPAGNGASSSAGGGAAGSGAAADDITGSMPAADPGAGGL